MNPPVGSPKPLRLAVTLGDPAGIGPEIILRLFAREGDFHALSWKVGCPVAPFVVGEARHLEQAARSLKGRREEERKEQEAQEKRQGKERQEKKKEREERGRPLDEKKDAAPFHFQDDRTTSGGGYGSPAGRLEHGSGSPEKDALSAGGLPARGIAPDVLPIASLRIQTLAGPPSEFPGEGIVPVVQPPDFRFRGELAVGRVSAHCGAAAWAYIRHAVALVQNGAADGIVTAPLHKEALQAAGCPHPGHTEMLAALAGGARVAMLLVGGGLRVALATIHEPISRVPGLLTREGILEDLRLMDRFIPWFGIEELRIENEELKRKKEKGEKGAQESSIADCQSPIANRQSSVSRRPRIGVTGLNPHAGEGGMFGEEEREIIAPAIAAARAEGIDAVGPLPGDTVFYFHREGAYDAVLAMYHDQALIPVKTLAFHDGVNVTMGLPFIRTSVDHGTAFDIAGKGIALPDSLRAALECAAVLVRNRGGAQINTDK